jgi:hypothetical protein
MMSHVERLTARVKRQGETIRALAERLATVEELLKQAKGVSFDAHERPDFPSVEFFTKDPPEVAEDNDTWVDL